MSDPRRMIELDGPSEDGEGATPLERELLSAGRGQKLSLRNKDRIWLGISAQVLPPVMPSHPPTGSGAGAAAAAGVGTKTLTAAAVKGAIVVAMLGGGSLVSYHAIGSRRAPTVPVTTKASSSAEASVVDPLARPLEEPPPPRAQTPAARGAREEVVGRHPQPSRLAAEGRVVLEARRALREGDARGALRQLEAARGKFVDGAMVQEREALTIEALYRSGQQEVARQRAASFLSTYPGSPHAASVRTYGGP